MSHQKALKTKLQTDEFNILANGKIKIIQFPKYLHKNINYCFCV